MLEGTSSMPRQLLAPDAESDGMGFKRVARAAVNGHGESLACLSRVEKGVRVLLTLIG